MSKTGKLIFFTVLFLLLIGLSQSFGLEVGALFRLENLSFKTDRARTDASFSGTDLFWGLSIFATHTLSDKFSLEGGFYNDAILRNVTYTLFNYDEQFINLGIGPFFGLLNSATSILNPGISTSIRLAWPGKVFIYFRADNTIGGRLIEAGDYIQERNDISFGFYVYNAICTLNLNTRKFTQQQAGYEVIDSLTNYSFKTDIFQKNIPYRLLFSFSFQTLSKKFTDTAADHALSSIILGTEVDFQVTDVLGIMLNLESSIYTFGQGELSGLSNPGPAGFLFRAYAGCKINFDKL